MDSAADDYVYALVHDMQTVIERRWKSTLTYPLGQAPDSHLIAIFDKDCRWQT